MYVYSVAATKQKNFDLPLLIAGGQKCNLLLKEWQDPFPSLSTRHFSLHFPFPLPSFELSFLLLIFFF